MFKIWIGIKIRQKENNYFYKKGNLAENLLARKTLAMFPDTYLMCILGYCIKMLDGNAKMWINSKTYNFVLNWMET